MTMILEKETTSIELREQDLRNFEGLSAVVKNDNGLAGLHEKRQKNFQQFFTPLEICKLIIDMLNIPEGKRVKILDVSCGSGRFFHYLPNVRFTGIEVEKKAYEFASKYFSNNIHHGCMLEFKLDEYDYCIGNPPFSLPIVDNFNLLENSGYQGKTLSHIAQLEIMQKAIKPSNGFMGLVLPSNIWETQNTIKIHKWLMEKNLKEIARISLPRKCFANTEWPCSVFIFKQCHGYFSFNNLEKFTYEMQTLADCDTVLELWKESGYWEHVEKFSANCQYPYRSIFKTPIKLKMPKAKSYGKREFKKERGVAKLHIHKRNQIIIKKDDIVNALKEQQAIQFVNGSRFDGYLNKREQVQARMKCNRRNNYGLAEAYFSSDLDEQPIVKQLKRLNANLAMDEQNQNTWHKKLNRFKRNSTPFIQDVSTPDGWEKAEQYNNIQNIYSNDFERRLKRVVQLSKTYPWLLMESYPYQIVDAIRASMKDSVILACQQGTGKTRTSIMSALIRGSKRILIVLPPRLINNWLKEFESLAMSDLVSVIDDKTNLREVKLFSIISNNTLKKRTGKKPNSYFAKRIGNYFNCIISDESHEYSNRTSHVTRAFRCLRAKYKIFCTGTPTRNTVNNLYSLLEILYGYSAMFPFTTKEFKDCFVKVEKCSAEFEDSLSNGWKMQQMAEVDNLDSFISIMRYVWIRRVQKEPDVVVNFKVPDPEIIEEEIQPCDDHIELYRNFIEYFAQIFNRMLSEEMKAHYGDDKTIKAAQILAQLLMLEFVSNIPQSEKVRKEAEVKIDLTRKQQRVLEIIKENRNSKILFVTKRPDLCKFLHGELSKVGIASGIFTGDVSISKRNRILDDFRTGTCNVLLTTLGTIAVGYNIPEGEIAIINEPDWKYSDLEQAMYRLIRPQTKHKPIIYLLRNKVFIDGYLWQHCLHKQNANDQSLDRQQGQDLEWSHWRDMCSSMLKDMDLLDKEFEHLLK